MAATKVTEETIPVFCEKFEATKGVDGEISVRVVSSHWDTLPVPLPVVTERK